MPRGPRTRRTAGSGYRSSRRAVRAVEASGPELQEAARGRTLTPVSPAPVRLLAVRDVVDALRRAPGGDDGAECREGRPQVALQRSSLEAEHVGDLGQRPATGASHEDDALADRETVEGISGRGEMAEALGKVGQGRILRA